MMEDVFELLVDDKHLNYITCSRGLLSEETEWKT